jgi:hypothetical protein
MRDRDCRCRLFRWERRYVAAMIPLGLGLGWDSGANWLFDQLNLANLIWLPLILGTAWKWHSSRPPLP